jgi:hypothetical protein
VPRTDNQKTAYQVQRSWPFLSRAQALRVAQSKEKFFGFDSRNHPVIHGQDRAVAIDSRGNEMNCVPPVVRAYIGSGQYVVRVLAEVEVKVTTEEGLDEQVETAVKESTLIRNRIARKVHDLLRIGTPYSDFEVGWLDDERSIALEHELVSVKILAMGTQKRDTKS